MLCLPITSVPSTYIKHLLILGVHMVQNSASRKLYGVYMYSRFIISGGT